MKKIILALLVLIGLIYLYLVFVVNAEKKHIYEFKKLEPDSIRINDSTYHFKISQQ